MTARTRVATREAKPRDRIVIIEVSPLVAGGRFPLKRVVGEPVVVRATVFADGHDELFVMVAHQTPGSRTWATVPMWSPNPGLDLWEASFVPNAIGLHRFRITAWVDRFASWQAGTARKLEARHDISSELTAGAAMVEAAAAGAPARERAPLLDVATSLREGDPAAVTSGIDGIEDGHLSVRDRMRTRLARAAATDSDVVEVFVEREKALFSSWYELFPRSWSTDPDRRPHGNLRDVAGQLDYVDGLGFDVLYLPPIHPIGDAFRKGRDNTEGAGPDDPGSPWAIGGATASGASGGHDAIHPELGTIADLDHLVAEAARRGIDVALDLALQCSPDHPWVTEHPEWFAHRPDGSIQYAENPPKRYQDIYPLDFDTADWRGLWDEILRIVRFWLDHGITVFRVDNPHTKPFAFWEWLIVQVHATHPETLFLAEAFTRPAIMRRLAQLGFTQSYTYFTWRSSKAELTDYFGELSTPPSVDELRPNAWPNTPDILSDELQGASPPRHALRLLLAATLSPSYGIYGPVFELAEGTSAGGGREEYGRSEKYEIRRWDLEHQRSIAPLIRQVNAIRTAQEALHTLRTLRFHEVGNDALICYSKTTHDGPRPDPATPESNPVLMVVNLDDASTQGGVLSLDLGALGIDADRTYVVDDLLSGTRYEWRGANPYVQLDPGVQPGHVLRVSQGPEDPRPASPRPDSASTE